MIPARTVPPRVPVVVGVLALAAWGCRPSTEPDASRRAIAFAAATDADTPHARADRCANAASTATSEEPKRAMRTVVEGCLSIYREQGCRDAQLEAIGDTTDPSQRIRILTDGCAQAYCGKLPNPRPRLCDAPANVDSSTYLARSLELTAAIRVFELGAPLAQRVEDAFERAKKTRESETPK